MAENCTLYFTVYIWIEVYENDSTFGMKYTGLTIEKNGDVHELKQGHKSQPQKNEKSYVQEVENILADNGDKEINYHVEKVNIIDNGDIEVIGWGFINGMDSSDQRIFLQIIEANQSMRTFEAEIVDRQDVFDAFPEEKSTHSGFRARINKESIEGPSLDLRIILKNGDILYQTPIHSFEISPS
jgi:hypothetical protein